jgi:hypothetical protein
VVVSDPMVMELGAIWAGNRQHFSSFKARIYRDAHEMLEAGQIELLSGLRTTSTDDGLKAWYDVRVLDPDVLKENRKA